jgi:hypothetical protein
MPSQALIIRTPTLPTRPYGSMPRRATLAGQRTRVQLLRARSRSTYTILCASRHFSTYAQNLYALFALHRRRRVQFRARIAEAPFLTDSRLVYRLGTLLTPSRAIIVR